MEAIDEFLESGDRPTKIASSVIKIATAAELLLKEKLERICPALVLDTIDENALQVAKIFELGNKMQNRKELDGVELKTAAFPKLLNRTSKFFDLKTFKSSLSKLHEIRNSLVHHRGKVDLAEVNILLIEKVFPFFEEFTRNEKYLQFRLKPEIWKRLKKLEESSWDAVVTDTAKKLAHYEDKAKRLSKQRTALLLEAAPEPGEDEEIVSQGLQCPACRNNSLSAFSSFDVDFDETGPVSGHILFTMRCGVCGLELEEDEIHLIIAQFEKFFGATGTQDQKDQWEEAVQEPDYSDAY